MDVEEMKDFREESMEDVKWPKGMVKEKRESWEKSEDEREKVKVEDCVTKELRVY